MFSKEKRSSIMACVPSKNTSPEKIVRSLLHKMGYRFRIHRRDLPGSPDIVLPRYHIAIFVNGCFWHQHQECSASKRPVSNSAYWIKKLDGNVQRDLKNMLLLHNLGWEPFVVWECELRNLDKLKARLSTLLTPKPEVITNLLPLMIKR